MTKPISPALAVYIDDAYVGKLYNETPLAFEYDAAWLAHPEAKAIDAAIPLQAEKLNSAYVYAYFENLLPEGHQRDIISLRHQVSSVFGLLAKVGGDSAGAVVILAQSDSPATHYRRTTWEQLGSQFASPDAESPDDENAPEREPQRLSISGAQFKILVSIDRDGAPLMPLSNSPSTHIVKPDIVRADMKIFSSAINETLMMRTAYHCGLPTAEVHYEPSLSACIVKRFDREMKEDGRLIRLAQADCCQLSGVPSDVKYEMDGGPGFVDCFHLVSRYSVMPAVDQRNLLKWLFFNLYIGNNDSHAKNLSLLHTKAGLRLAPFYDLMCTRIYSGLARHFAFQIGGEYQLKILQAAHFEALASELTVNSKYLKKIANDLAHELPLALDKAAAELSQGLAPAEHIMLERVSQKVRTLTKQIHSRINGLI